MMKTRLLLICSMLTFCVLALPGIASADWSENFDSYVLGSGLHGQGGWHGWDGSPAADAYVTDLYSSSAPHSAVVTGSSDIVHEYDGYTTGPWVFTAWQYIPVGFSGASYFILLNTYNNGGPYNWSCQVAFDSATGLLVSDPDGGTLPLLRGQWVEIRILIDLNQNLQTFYYGGQMLFQKSWTEGLSGGGALNIDAIDLYANSASPVYYDDLSLRTDLPTAVEPATWGRIKHSYR
jgi:hypothetical protein